MVKILKSALLGLCMMVVMLSPRVAKAQDATTTMQGLEPRVVVGTILMAGLVGGILGLSTLSFYERPQDNIRNITFGAGVGMIAVALFMTYDVTENVKGSTNNQRALLGVPLEQAQPSWFLVPSYDPASSMASAQFIYNF